MSIDQMTKHANKKRTDVSFKVGDFVLLRLHKYRQFSIARRLSNKLKKRYFGPFKIIKAIGKVAYQFELPEGSRIHNVFHISLLKKFVGDAQTIPPSTLPPDIIGIEDDPDFEEGRDDTDAGIHKQPDIASGRGKRTIKAPDRLDL